MGDIAIQVDSLGKMYRIGGKQEPYKRFTESLMDTLVAPFRRLRNLGQPVPPEETLWALKDVSFKVKQGEVLGIIGRNGAGKSTLLKILSRITEPTEGEARVYGRVGSLLEVGTGFHPELTGRENIYLNGAILGMTRAEITRKFDEIVDFAEVDKFLDTPVKRYSSGMYVRLAFAVAAHLEPEVLVVDEVLAVGDAQFQKKCLGKMGEVAKGGRTVLFVSHNMNAVSQLCGSIVLLDEGRLKVASRDVSAVIKQYLFDHKNQLSTGWKNPGNKFNNPWFKPIRFFIADENGNPKYGPHSNNVDIWVWVEAEILELDPALTIGYAIYTDNGDTLYWSYHTDQAESQWPELHPGVCRLKSKIPARFLNEGVYRLEMIGGLHFREWLFKPAEDCPSVQLTIQGGLSDSPYWMRKRPGILAPVREWNIVE